MSVIIREKTSGTVLAEAPQDVLNYEGNLYFEPTTVSSGVLRLTEKTYTCPYKGTCHWVDFHGPEGAAVPNVAWVYTDPKSGHEAIKGRYGFYAGSRGPTVQEG